VAEEATMIDDEPSPLKRPVVTLDLMSIEELEARIAAAKADIEACEAMIASKRRQRAAADAVFGKREA
jgi:uncharacterized small protein (DUF1192 family)